MYQAKKIALGVVAASCAGIANFSYGAVLPTSGLVLALGADSGVTPTSGAVTAWTDENSGTQRVASTAGTPTI